MNLLIIIFLLIITVETTCLTIRSLKHPLINPHAKRKLYVDTSALMDPRLLAIADTGVISDDIIVPRSVTHELQLLADGKDSDRRARARAGLDAVSALERNIHFNTTILDDDPNCPAVDDRLIELAAANHGAILSNDYNLQKVAETEHITVININELALVLRVKCLPGEKARLKLVAAGSVPHQGVGYLEDGTMVIVDKAVQKIGQEVEVEFLKLNQTASGTLMFARLVKESVKQPKRTRSRLAKL